MMASSPAWKFFKTSTTVVGLLALGTVAKNVVRPTPPTNAFIRHRHRARYGHSRRDDVITIARFDEGISGVIVVMSRLMGLMLMYWFCTPGVVPVYGLPGVWNAI